MTLFVYREQDRTISFLESLVNQNRGSLNAAGVEAVGGMVRAELEPLGFEVNGIPLPETGRAGHLVATHTGDHKRKRLLLIGHLDTVFEPESPLKRFERAGDRATGPGIGDDKGGIAVIVAALRAMHAAGTLKRANIKVVLTGDEEKHGTPLGLARRDLVQAGRWADVALDYENLVFGWKQGLRHRRPPQRRLLDAHRQGPHRPFERRLRRAARLRCDLRARPHSRRLPPRAARAQPHLQCPGRRRRHASDA